MTVAVCEWSSLFTNHVSNTNVIKRRECVLSVFKRCQSRNVFLVYSFSIATQIDGIHIADCFPDIIIPMFVWKYLFFTIYIYIYKYYERKKGHNYISRQACFMKRFTLQGFNERIFIWLSCIYWENLHNTR